MGQNTSTAIGLANLIVPGILYFFWKQFWNDSGEDRWQYYHEDWERFKEKPKGSPPPPPPSDDENISQDDLIRDARIKLNMDVINNYNFALCGPRGTGKSTFINCIRQLNDPKPEDSVRNYDSQSAAPVGTTETTDEVKSYKFPPSCPELQHVVLWDMPGSGTVKHPLESYFKDKMLYAFDCLLITSDSKRFGPEQIRIMNEAQKYNTPVVLIITMLELAVNDKVEAEFGQNEDYEPTLDQYHRIVKQTIEELKSYVERQQNIVPRSRIFVISAKRFRAYLNSIDPQSGTYTAKYLLLSGEMRELILHITSESSRRRNQHFLLQH